MNTEHWHLRYFEGMLAHRYTSDVQKTFASAYHLYICEWICYRFIALEPREYPQMAQHFMIKGGGDHYIMDHADCCRSQYGSTLIWGNAKALLRGII